MKRTRQTRSRSAVVAKDANDEPSRGMESPAGESRKAKVNSSGRRGRSSNAKTKAHSARQTKKRNVPASQDSDHESESVGEEVIQSKNKPTPRKRKSSRSARKTPVSKKLKAASKIEEPKPTSDEEGSEEEVVPKKRSKPRARKSKASSRKAPRKTAVVESESGSESEPEPDPLYSSDDGGDPDASEGEASADESEEEKAPPKSAKKKSARKRRPTPEPEVVFDEDLTEVDFFDLVRNSTSAVGPTLKQWRAHYATVTEHPSQHVVQLVNFLMQCSAVPFRVDMSDIKQQRVEDLVGKSCEKVQTVAPEEIPEFILGQRTKDGRKFQRNFRDFFRKLFRFFCPDLLSSSLLKDLTEWITVLSAANLWTFRYCGTLAGLTLVTQACELAVECVKDQVQKQRQLDASKAKKKSKKVDTASLEGEIDGLQSQRIAIEEVITSLFQGLFMHRYRDARPEIRVRCVEALGQWIVAYPTHFLNDSSLKYLGWIVHDKSKDVRKACVQSLVHIYSKEEFFPQLDRFTKRFLVRMVDLTRDIDPLVAAEGVKLCTRLLKFGVLNAELKQKVVRLLIQKDARIAGAASAFVWEMLKAEKIAGDSEAGSGFDSAALISLVKFIAEVETSQENVFISKVVHALLEKPESVTLLSDWKSLLNFATSDSQIGKMGATAQFAVLKIIASSARILFGLADHDENEDALQAQIGGGDKVKIADRRKLMKASVLESSHNDFTSAAADLLVDLLERFEREGPAVAQVAMLIPCLNLSNLGRKSHFVEELTQVIERLFFKLTDTASLRALASALNYLAVADHPHQMDATASVRSVYSRVVVSVRESSAPGETEDAASQKEADREFQLGLALSRANALLQRVRPADAIEVLGVHVEFFNRLLKEQLSVTEEAIVVLAENCMLGIGWYHGSVTRSVDGSIVISNEDLDRVKGFQKAVYAVLQELLKDDTLSVLETAVQCLCNFCIMYSENNYGTVTKSLVFVPSREDRIQFMDSAEAVLQTLEEEMRSAADNKEEFEELRLRRLNVIRAMCMVCMFVHSFQDQIAVVLTHYVGHGPDVSAHIKRMWSVVRQRQKDSHELELDALQRLCLQAVENAEIRADSFRLLADISRALSSVHAKFVKGSQRDVVNVLRGGIDFIKRAQVDYEERAVDDAYPEGYFSFIEYGLMPYAKKLTRPGAGVLAKWLRENGEPESALSKDGWDSLVHLMNGIFLMADSEEKVKAATAFAHSGSEASASKASSRKRRAKMPEPEAMDSGSETDDVEDEKESADDVEEVPESDVEKAEEEEVEEEEEEEAPAEDPKPARRKRKGRSSAPSEKSIVEKRKRRRRT